MSARAQRSLTAEVESTLGPAPASYATAEVVVARVRRHGKRLVLPVLVLFISSVTAGVYVGALPETWMNLLAGSGVILVAVGLGLIPIIAWLSRRTTVTSRRVILRSGVLVRHRSEVPLSLVREVRTRRSLGQRLWGSGDIVLLHGAESTRLAGVPGVVPLADALQELVERNFAHATRSHGGAEYPADQVLRSRPTFTPVPAAPPQPLHPDAAGQQATTMLPATQHGAHPTTVQPVHGLAGDDESEFTFW